MKSRPVTIVAANSVSTPAKRTLFRVALSVALVGVISVSTVLIVQGGFELGRLQYFDDVGKYSRYVSSALLFGLGLISLLTFIILTIGLVKVNKKIVTIATVLLGICSIGLITFSIQSFLTITNGQLPESINNTITKELDQTQYSVSTENIITVENTLKMARLEKQYQCCGLMEPIEEYRSRQPSMFGSLNPSSSSGSSGSRTRTSSTQRTTSKSGSTVLLPISCCNKHFRSSENLCVDMFANNTSPINRYNIDGCYNIVVEYKNDRIKRQGLTAIAATCLAVISCIALAAVTQLLGESYQTVPLHAAT